MLPRAQRDLARQEVTLVPHRAVLRVESDYFGAPALCVPRRGGLSTSHERTKNDEQYERRTHAVSVLALGWENLTRSKTRIWRKGCSGDRSMRNPTNR